MKTRSMLLEPFQLTNPLGVRIQAVNLPQRAP